MHLWETTISVLLPKGLPPGSLSRLSKNYQIRIYSSRQTHGIFLYACINDFKIIVYIVSSWGGGWLGASGITVCIS